MSKSKVMGFIRDDSLGCIHIVLNSSHRNKKNVSLLGFSCYCKQKVRHRLGEGGKFGHLWESLEKERSVCVYKNGDV